jgi:hypothetical protein
VESREGSKISYAPWKFGLATPSFPSTQQGVKRAGKEIIYVISTLQGMKRTWKEIICLTPTQQGVKKALQTNYLLTVMLPSGFDKTNTDRFSS